MRLKWTVDPRTRATTAADEAGNVYTFHEDTGKTSCRTPDGRGGEGLTAKEALEGANRARPTQPDLFAPAVMPWNLLPQ